MSLRTRSSSSLRSPELAPPSGFDLNNPRDLIRYGYPARPRDNSSQVSKDYFKLFVSPNLHYVKAEPNLNRRCKPLSTPNWSGAILRKNSFQNVSEYDSVCGSFVVPDAYPPLAPSKCGEPAVYENGDFECFTFVGLGGYDQKEYLIIGVLSKVTSENGKISKQEAVLRGGNENGDFEFDNFTVKPGDLVTGYVRYNYSEEDGKRYSYVSIVNQSAKTKTSHLFEAGKPLDSAEWILEADISRAGQVIDFPDYGATFFYHTAAEYKDKEGQVNETNAKFATLVNMAEGQSRGERFQDVVVVSYYHS